MYCTAQGCIASLILGVLNMGGSGDLGDHKPSVNGGSGGVKLSFWANNIYLIMVLVRFLVVQVIL